VIGKRIMKKTILFYSINNTERMKTNICRFIFLLLVISSENLFAVTLSGKLIDKSNLPVSATINIYQPGAADPQIWKQTGSEGNYALSIPPGCYDIEYNMIDFSISRLSIRFSSVDFNSDLADLINYIAEIPSGNRLVFNADIKGDRDN
jgi:hypothetical protein